MAIQKPHLYALATHQQAFKNCYSCTADNTAGVSQHCIPSLSSNH
jgi:hypothetical protein